MAVFGKPHLHRRPEGFTEFSLCSVYFECNRSIKCAFLITPYTLGLEIQTYRRLYTQRIV